jgi:hypothetical protein
MAKADKIAPPPVEEAPLVSGDFTEPPPDSMDLAPKDGRWIDVTEDGEAWTRVRWYVTRVRAVGSIAWVPARCWSTSEPAKLAHRVENPIAWRYPVE